MRALHTSRLLTALRILCALAAAALGALVLHLGQPGHLAWWAGSLPLALWVIGPAVTPCLVASRRSPPWFVIAMLAYLAVSSLLSGLAYADAFFRSTSSTAALTLVFIPLYQWVALAVLLLLCLGVRLGRRGVGR